MVYKEAKCPGCKSIRWTIENVIHKDGQGIIQAECGDCGRKFEMFVECTESGWTQ